MISLVSLALRGAVAADHRELSIDSHPKSTCEYLPGPHSANQGLDPGGPSVVVMLNTSQIDPGSSFWNVVKDPNRLEIQVGKNPTDSLLPPVHREVLGLSGTYTGAAVVFDKTTQLYRVSRVAQPTTSWALTSGVPGTVRYRSEDTGWMVFCLLLVKSPRMVMCDLEVLADEALLSVVVNESDAETYSAFADFVRSNYRSCSLR